MTYMIEERSTLAEVQYNFYLIQKLNYKRYVQCQSQLDVNEKKKYI